MDDTAVIFSINDILQRTRRQPFVPFRIVTTTGQTYDIYHPDQAFAARRCVTVPLLGPDGRTDRGSEVAYLHITELQELPTLTPAA